MNLGRREGAQRLRALIALAEKAGLANSTYMKAHLDLELLFGFHRYQACRRYTYIHEGNTHTHEIKNKSFKNKLKVFTS